MVAHLTKILQLLTSSSNGSLNKKRVNKLVVFNRLPNVAAIDSADFESTDDLIRRIVREMVHRALNPEPPYIFIQLSKYKKLMIHRLFRTSSNCLMDTLSHIKIQPIRDTNFLQLNKVKIRVLIIM
ncbi:hypothetical protein LAZ67_22000676 [Cordylochernes scorpioides]|uniref:Uncharacterized protein n=1 Tax=Cordylochernes scorpioides TaxID=51811 RepID=A0ABY6LT88_9ARAC|nr:hypothetical protein LAZ67_22000676 [Cordylochernes scorpioides]